MKEIDVLKSILKESENIVFFGGAGVSVPSGIPDFRSSKGIFSRKESVSPEEILSHSYFLAYPKEFYSFYRKNMIYPRALPNDAHYALFRLEQSGKLKAVITQNIDGLHQLAGSKNVLELHGSIHRNYCMKCHKEYSLSDVLKKQDIPKCTCGGIIRPDVVLYEEALDEEVLEQSVEYISKAQTFIVAGTSLAVYPAAGLIRYFKGKDLILITKSETAYDSLCNLIIRESVDSVLKEAVSGI